jgi:hypothetical protein
VNSVTYGATEKEGSGDDQYYNNIITKCLSIANKDSLKYYA